MKQPAIYILASKRNGTLYTGVTSNFIQRTAQHKSGIFDGFSREYGCGLLVHYELYEDMETAITREQQINSGSRKKKLVLIEHTNPEWNDLYETIL